MQFAPLARKKVRILQLTAVIVLLVSFGGYLTWSRYHLSGASYVTPAANRLSNHTEITLYVTDDDVPSSGLVNFGTKICPKPVGGIDGYYRCEAKDSEAIKFSGITYTEFTYNSKNSADINQQTSTIIPVDDVMSLRTVPIGSELLLHVRLDKNTGTTVDKYVNGAWVDTLGGTEL